MKFLVLLLLMLDKHLHVYNRKIEFITHKHTHYSNNWDNNATSCCLRLEMPYIKYDYTQIHCDVKIFAKFWTKSAGPQHHLLSNTILCLYLYNTEMYHRKFHMDQIITNTVFMLYCCYLVAFWIISLVCCAKRNKNKLSKEIGFYCKESTY